MSMPAQTRCRRHKDSPNHGEHDRSTESLANPHTTKTKVLIRIGRRVVLCGSEVPRTLSFKRRRRGRIPVTSVKRDKNPTSSGVWTRYKEIVRTEKYTTMSDEEFEEFLDIFIDGLD